MKKLGIVLCSLLLFSGCSVKEEETAVSILTPKGAPSLAFAEAMTNDLELLYKTVDGTDIISAEMVKENPSYDIIVAPINLGVKLIENNADYSLNSVITWGNLYVVATQDYLNDPKLVAFGENAVPQKILDLYLQEHPELNNLTYVNSAADAQAQLLAQQANIALLAQPVAAATIAKGKELGLQLSIIANLQEVYADTYKSKHTGYPQAAIFVKKGSEQRVATLLDDVKTFVNETMGSTPEVLESYIDFVGAEELGVPNATIAIQTWNAQNINFVDASEVVDDLNQFLKMFNLEVTDTILMK